MDDQSPEQPRRVLAYRTPGPEPGTVRPWGRTIGLFTIGFLGGFAMSGMALFAITRAPNGWQLRLGGGYIALKTALAFILGNLPKTRPIGLGLLVSIAVIILIPLGVCGVAMMSH